MRATVTMLLHNCRVTLFTRANCGLCDKAKLTLGRVWEKSPFEYSEIDVMSKHGEHWKDLYEFDTPVVHVQNVAEEFNEPASSSRARKLMHRFKEEDVENLMSQVEDEAMR